MLLTAAMLLTLCACGGTASDEDNTGSDWRTWKSFAYLDMDMDGEMFTVIADVLSDRVVLYYDKAEQEEYAVIGLPFDTADTAVTLDSLIAGDVNGDGFSDVILDVVSDSESVGVRRLVFLRNAEASEFELSNIS